MPIVASAKVRQDTNVSPAQLSIIQINSFVSSANRKKSDINNPVLMLTINYYHHNLNCKFKLFAHSEFMIEAGLGFGLHNLKPPFEKSRSKNVSLDCPIFSVLTFFGASNRDMDQLFSCTCGIPHGSILRPTLFSPPEHGECSTDPSLVDKTIC